MWVVARGVGRAAGRGWGSWSEPMQLRASFMSFKPQLPPACRGEGAQGGGGNSGRRPGEATPRQSARGRPPPCAAATRSRAMPSIMTWHIAPFHRYLSGGEWRWQCIRGS